MSIKDITQEKWERRATDDNLLNAITDTLGDIKQDSCFSEGTVNFIRAVADNNIDEQGKPIPAFFALPKEKQSGIWKKIKNDSRAKGTILPEITDQIMEKLASAYEPAFSYENLPNRSIYTLLVRVISDCPREQKIYFEELIGKVRWDKELNPEELRPIDFLGSLDDDKINKIANTSATVYQAKYQEEMAVILRNLRDFIVEKKIEAEATIAPVVVAEPEKPVASFATRTLKAEPIEPKAPIALNAKVNEYQKPTKFAGWMEKTALITEVQAKRIVGAVANMDLGRKQTVKITNVAELANWLAKDQDGNGSILYNKALYSALGSDKEAANAAKTAIVDACTTILQENTSLTSGQINGGRQ